MVFSYPSALAIARMLQHIAHPLPLMKLGTGSGRAAAGTGATVSGKVAYVTGRAAGDRLLSIL